MESWKDLKRKQLFLNTLAPKSKTLRADLDLRLTFCCLIILRGQRNLSLKDERRLSSGLYCQIATDKKILVLCCILVDKLETTTQSFIVLCKTLVEG